MSISLKSLVLIVSLSLAAAGVSFAEGSCVVTASQGNAVVIRGTETIPAASGMPVQKGDVVKTSEGSVDISLNGKVGARILAGSETSIEDTTEESMRLSILSGNAILNLDKLPATSSFSVETPTAIASVRGTQFWGRVELGAESPVTTFAVRNGVVDVLAKASSRVFKLEKSQALDIPKSADIPSIRPALDGEMQAMAQADSIRISA